MPRQGWGNLRGHVSGLDCDCDCDSDCDCDCHSQSHSPSIDLGRYGLVEA
jgi:hypothetical protein